MHKNANGQVHVFPCFSLFDVPFRSPFILLPVFFGFEVSLFEFPCGFLFLACFSSLKIIRISYSGEHKTRQDHSISTLYIMYIYIYTDWCTFIQKTWCHLSTLRFRHAMREILKKHIPPLHWVLLGTTPAPKAPGKPRQVFCETVASAINMGTLW